MLIGIESKQLKLVEVIQSMGEYMTDDDATVRAKCASPFRIHVDKLGY